MTGLLIGAGVLGLGVIATLKIRKQYDKDVADLLHQGKYVGEPKNNAPPVLPIHFLLIHKNIERVANVCERAKNIFQ